MPQINRPTMQNILRNAFNIGLLASISLFATNEAQAQKTKREKRHEWMQPDIKYVDQRSFALGVTYGMTDLWADVGTKGPIDHYANGDYWNNLKGMGGIFMKYTHIPGLALRVGVSNGTLYANDRWNEDAAARATDLYADPVQRYYRNLDVKTNIWEGTMMFEISPFQLFGNWEFGKRANGRFQPYLLAGFGGMYFNPRGTFVKDFETGQKEWIDLRPLATEGQNFDKAGYPQPYSRYAMVVPAGIGFRVDIGRGLSIGMEYIMRYTFTDYLDDVSGKYVDPKLFDIAFLNEGHKPVQARQMADRTRELLPGSVHAAGEYRGDPSTNDMYSTLSLNFYWRITKRAIPWWR